MAQRNRKNSIIIYRKKRQENNYPLYKKLLKKGKEKYAFEILELAKEITGEA